MTAEIPRRRLRNQRLTGQPFESPVEVVRWFGAVQAQDYGGAKWAIGQRARDTTDADIDHLFDAGSILRTHVMRPTWHFVLPEDVRWLLALTGPRIRSGLVGRYRELDIDARQISRASDGFSKELSGSRYLTRLELGQVLSEIGVAPDGQRLPHFLMAAELEGVLVSGPRRGKQFTYGLLDERAPAGSGVDRSEALVGLARRYFRGHGPAHVQDFVWWSGLTAADARSAVGLAGGLLERQIVDGREYWLDADAPATAGVETVVHLLPNFDEYTVGYRDRSLLLDPARPFEVSLFSFGSVLSNVVTVDGRVRGAWRRTFAGDAAHLEVRGVDCFNSDENAELEQARHRFGHFLERRVELTVG